MSAVTTSVADLDTLQPALRLAGVGRLTPASVVKQHAPPEPAPTLFDFICTQLRIRKISESPRVYESPKMVEIIGRIVDLENSRIYRHDSLSFPLQATHNFALFDFNPVDKDKEPPTGRVVLLANTALRILRIAEDRLTAYPQQAQYLHGIGATMVLIASHARQGAPSLELYHEFMMQFVYRDVPVDGLSAYQSCARRLMGELRGIADEQIILNTARQLPNDFFNPAHYKDLKMQDLDETVRAQCRRMSNDQLGAMLDRARQDPHNIAWIFLLTGKNELAGRLPLGIRGATRAAIEARYACNTR